METNRQAGEASRRLIDIGDGRIVEMTEMGEQPALHGPEPRNRNPGVKAGLRRKSERSATFAGSTTYADNAKNFHARDDVPGYREWVRDRQSEARFFVEKPKSRMGVPDGMRRKEADERREEAKDKASKDMATLKRAGIIQPDEERAEEALMATLEIMHGPHCDDLKLKAARQVIEWTKPKPAKKARVNVRPSEEWLAALDDDEGEGE